MSTASSPTRSCWVLASGFFAAPLTIEPISTTAFSAGAVAHVFAAHP